MKNTEQPAFPLSSLENGRWPDEVEKSGLTKREYFAAMAMQGLLAGHPEASIHEIAGPPFYRLIPY